MLNIQDQDVRWQLSGAQSGIWFAQQLEPDNPIYNTGEYIEIDGRIDIEHFEQALKQAVMEAEFLHVRFGEDHNGPFQVSGESSEFPFEFIDISGEENPRDKAMQWMKKDLAQPIDLKNDPLFNQALIKVDSDRFFWYQRIHHIVMDAFGFSLISQRIAKLYTALQKGQSLEEGAFAPLRLLLKEDEAYRKSEKF